MKEKTRSIIRPALNIGERRRAEDGLRWLSQAVEQTPASVAITRLKLNGYIDCLNPKFMEVTGYRFDSDGPKKLTGKQAKPPAPPPSRAPAPEPPGHPRSRRKLLCTLRRAVRPRACRWPRTIGRPGNPDPIPRAHETPARDWHPARRWKPPAIAARLPRDRAPML